MRDNSLAQYVVRTRARKRDAMTSVVVFIAMFVITGGIVAYSVLLSGQMTTSSVFVAAIAYGILVLQMSEYRRLSGILELLEALQGETGEFTLRSDSAAE